jgi:hypothetical protein
MAANEKLDLPQPVKSRILLEIASDLEDLYQDYRRSGLGESAALARARETFEISDDALSELVDIHETAMRKLLNRISDQARTRWERSILVAVILSVAVLAGRIVLTDDYFALASGFVWPVVACGVAACAVFVAQVYRLFIKKDHRAQRLRQGLPWMQGAGVGGLVSGIAGFAVESYRLAGAIAVGSVRPLPAVVDWGIGGAALAIATLLTVMGTAIAWFVLVTKIERIESDEAAWLLE